MSTTKPLLNGISQALIKAVTYYRNQISPYKGYECGCRTQLGLSSCSQHAQDQLSTQPLSIALKQIKARSVLCRSLSPSKVGFKQGLGVFALATVTGCGSSPTPTPTPVPAPTPTPTPKVGKLYIDNQATGGALLPLGNIAYKATPTPVVVTASTSAEGTFNYMSGGTVSFDLLGNTISALAGADVVTHKQLATQLCSTHTDPSTCAANAEINIKNLAASLDEDKNSANGYNLSSQQSTLPLFDLTTSPAVFSDSLQAAGITLVPSFMRFMGVNGEEPQPESDTVGGQPLPFADVFRVARPFKEYSCPDITYDANGWATSIPSSCASQSNPFLRSATTGTLRNAPVGAIPEGQYVVLYEGSGTLAYSGIARGTNTGTGRDTIDVAIASRIASDRTSGIRVQITATDPANPIRNIRIVMPGGMCTSNLFKRVNNSTDCPQGDYQSFESQLSTNRNKILFNPDYLRELSYFKVLRTMNLMKASPSRIPVITLTPLTDTNGAYLYDGNGDPTYSPDRFKANSSCYYKSTKGTAKNVDGTNKTYETSLNKEYYDCLLQPLTWSQRSTLDNAVWGGSGATPLLQRYGRGMPLEVIIELANTLKMDPWFTIPHNADDEYVRQFATMVNARLDPTLKPYIEYSNETWNGVFWAALYVRKKGMDLGLGASYTNAPEFWAGSLYTAKRSKEIFSIWTDVFGTNSRFVRVLGSFYNNVDLSRNMLNYDNTASVVDALAIAPYFRGCWNRTATGCTEANVPKLLSQATNVDDVFSIINNAKDPYGLSAIIEKIKQQKAVAAAKNVGLVAYEGGQHLTVDWTDTTLTTDQKNVLRTIFEAANRDLRMGTAYSTLLTEWKNAGGKLFVLYTMPQSFHQWGSWGLKDGLTKLRAESPKFDAVMSFQEKWVKAWW